MYDAKYNDMIKNAPKRIYLQVGDIPTDDIDFKDLHEVSWCEDKINDNDLCYIRAGKCYTPAVSKSKRLEHQVQLAMTGLEIISKRFPLNTLRCLGKEMYEDLFIVFKLGSILIFVGVLIPLRM